MVNKNTNIPIEDDPCDVIGKAMRGMAIDKATLANHTGLTENKITSILSGEIDSTAFQKLAPSLNLSATALANLSSYRPEVLAPEHMNIFTSPYGHAGVNAYIISQEDKAIVFDTGTDAAPILQFLSEKQLTLAAVVITHNHNDHTSSLKDFGATPVFFPEDMRHQERYNLGGIDITALDVSGHASPARAYYHANLTKPVCILGDAIFAGSIGGTSSPSNYQLALRTIRENILPLPTETILGTGHGPLTNIKSEMKHNPFLAN